MVTRWRAGRAGAVALALVASLGVVGCTDSEDECGWNSVGELRGTTVTVMGTFGDASGAEFKTSVQGFTDCTGAGVTFQEPAKDQSLGDAVGVALRNQAAPDIVVGDRRLMLGLDKTTMVPAPQQVVEALGRDYSAGWREQMSVDGAVYGVPVNTEVKSLVWYSPRRFAGAGYDVPTTWAQMMALTERIVADTPPASTRLGTRPWCAGFASGAASGWPGTDWVEEAALRVMGPEGYDRWVGHAIPFTTPGAVEAMQRVGSILKNPQYVNGGLGGVAGIAETYHLDTVRAILDGSCFLNHQAAFVANNFAQANAKVGPGKDVWAFHLPPISGNGKPILGTGELALALADRPEVKAFQNFLASEQWVNARAKATNANGRGWTSAHRGLVRGNQSREIDRFTAELLADDQAIFRYDGSDTMPTPVGAETWRPQMLAWVRGASDTAVLDAVEKAWAAQ